MSSRSHSTLRSLESISGHRERMDRYRSPGETRHRRRRRSTAGDTHRAPSSRSRIHETGRRHGDERQSSDSEDAATQSGSVEAKPVRKTRVVYVRDAGARSPLKERRKAEPREHRESTKHAEHSARRSRSHRPRQVSASEAVPVSPPKRYGFS